MPPPPAPVTAAVTRGDLNQSISSQAWFEAQFVQEFPLNSGAASTVVTATPLSEGAAVRGGSVLIELNGRPLIALTGVFPYYRDLAVGDSGPDVEQLQAALTAAGFPVAVDGDFGPTTASALARLYRAVGYSAPGLENAPRDATSATNTPDVVSMAMAEIATMTGSSAFVGSLPAVGASVDPTSSLTLWSGELQARVVLADFQIDQLTDGASVELRLADGSTVLGVIVARRYAQNESEPGSVTIAPSEGAFAPELRDQSAVALLTLQHAATDALIVPSAAIVSRGLDHSVVLKRLADGSFIEVDVIEVGLLSGRSAVVVDAGALIEGDLVKVG